CDRAQRSRQQAAAPLRGERVTTVQGVARTRRGDYNQPPASAGRGCSHLAGNFPAGAATSTSPPTSQRYPARARDPALYLAATQPRGRPLERAAAPPPNNDEADLPTEEAQ